MSNYTGAMEHMKKGGIAEINGWKYRMNAGDIERLNGWWQIPVWPITSEERSSSEWILRRKVTEPTDGETK